MIEQLLLLNHKRGQQSLLYFSVIFSYKHFQLPNSMRTEAEKKNSFALIILTIKSNN